MIKELVIFLVLLACCCSLPAETHLPKVVSVEAPAENSGNVAGGPDGDILTAAASAHPAAYRRYGGYGGYGGYGSRGGYGGYGGYGGRYGGGWRGGYGGHHWGWKNGK